MKEYKFNKNGVTFTVKFKNTDDMIIHADGFDCEAEMKTEELFSSVEGKHFAGYKYLKKSGKEYPGIKIEKNHVENLKSILKELENETSYKMDSFFETITQIKEFSCRYYSVISENREKIESLGESMFYNKEKKFIKDNKKFFVEVSRKSESYEAPQIIYELKNKIDEVKETLIRELTKEESKLYKKGDNVDNLLVTTRSREIDDIDCGKMYYTYLVFVKRETVETLRK